jgi:hypothetical protein
MSYRFSSQLVSGWKKLARVNGRPAESVSSGPPGLEDVDDDEDDDVLVSAGDVVSEADVDRAEVVDASAESPAKLLHPAAPSSVEASSAVPSIRRVRPMAVPSASSPRRPRNRRVEAGSPLRRRPETES